MLKTTTMFWIILKSENTSLIMDSDRKLIRNVLWMLWIQSMNWSLIGIYTRKHSNIASHNLDEVFNRVQSKRLFEYFHQKAMKTSHGWMELMA